MLALEKVWVVLCNATLIRVYKSELQALRYAQENTRWYSKYYVEGRYYSDKEEDNKSNII